MPVTMVTLARLAPGGEAHYQRYGEGVLPLLTACGARVRERLQGGETLVGEDAPDLVPDLVAVIEFPDQATMRAFLASDAYAACLPHREAAFAWLVSFAAEGF